MKYQLINMSIIWLFMQIVGMTPSFANDAVDTLKVEFARDNFALQLIDSLAKAETEIRNNPLNAHEIVRALLINDFINQDSYLAIKLEALSLAAKSSFRLGYYYSQIEYASTGLELAKTHHINSAIANYHTLRGQAYDLIGETQKALQDFDAAVTITQQLNDINLTFNTYRRRGDLFSYQGDYEAALKDLEVAYNIYVESGKHPKYSEVLNNLANLYSYMGSSEKALSTYKELITIQKQLGDRYSISTSLYNIARIHQQLGSYEQAKQTYQEALKISQSLNDIAGIAFSKSGLGILYQELNQVGKALALHQDALLGFKILKNKEQITRTYILIAESQFLLGHYKKALVMIENALSNQANQHSAHILRIAHQLRAKIHAKNADFERAYHSYVAFKSLDEEIYNQERDKQLNHLMVEFQTESKTKENQLLQKDNQLKQLQIEQKEKQSKLQYSIIALFAIFIIVLAISVSKLTAISKKLKLLAHTDELSGLPNRRAVLNRCTQEMARATRSEGQFSILIFDIDKFKVINDSYGHQTGDEVIRRVSATSQGLLRKHDAMGRIGGEEFLVLLPETDHKESLVIAERIRSEIAAINCQDLHEGLNVSVSVGATSLHASDNEINDLTHRADVALYEAKENGRNRVESSLIEALPPKQLNKTVFQIA